jgi:uncharacterized RDD family membrane protein YckC
MVEPAGLMVRLIAYVVDEMILGVPMIILFMVAGPQLPSDLAAFTPAAQEEFEEFLETAARLAAIMVVFRCAYYAVFEASRLRGTPGKLLFSITVRDEDGFQLGLVHAFWRGILKSATLWFMPILMAVVWFTPKNRALHDILAGTVVMDWTPEA